MRPLFLTLVALIAVLHIYVAWFEIFAWTSRGPVVFDTLPAELFAQTTELAANQGVYNAFLAAGLIWALFIRDRVWQRRVAICFLSFVLVAGIAAALTVSLRPGMFQILPSSVAIIVAALERLLARRSE
ncbi:DUF1304 domain-containing protein [uncultured Tateyamaria sp.]|uniref:DUF1304 domain-containing protein n=1 Tax=uncultured Tateyamaria sp. TaxID=455651 RepID=UPI002623BABA|nr:DUF1304 domain-containing protein [uncultured Tateyamaria sp.]